MTAQSDCSYQGDAFYCHVEFTDVEFKEHRNQGDITFCAECEDYFVVSFEETKCFKCRGFEYAPALDMKEIA